MLYIVLYIIYTYNNVIIF